MTVSLVRPLSCLPLTSRAAFWKSEMTSTGADMVFLSETSDEVAVGELELVHCIGDRTNFDRVRGHALHAVPRAADERERDVLRERELVAVRSQGARAFL